MSSGTLHPHASSSSTPLAADGAPAPKARFWDKVARKYAADPIADMAGYEATLDRTRALLAPTHRVLELGCGTGTTALRLAPSTGKLVATDVSPQMIAIARERLAAAPQPNVELQVADADAPVFGRACYDVVLAFNVLHLVSDLDGALAVVADALAPSGLFISKTPCIAEMNPLVPKLRHGFTVLVVEHHGTKGKDIRPFIVARKQDPADGCA